MEKQVKFKMLIVLWCTLIFASCERDYLQKPVPPVPPTSEETTALEASFVTTAPDKVNAAYWKTADYLNVKLQNLSTNQLYTEDGQLNVTGTYKGLSDFDNQGAQDLTLKAAYDDENVYILVEWVDYGTDAGRSNWFFNGPKDPLKSDTTGGWTTQKNDDKMALVFNGESATGSSGEFATNGCAVTCHNNQKKTQAGIADLWKWSLAESEPFGYAIDLSVNSSGIARDDFKANFKRNANDTLSFRSGPKYEWDGVKQEVTRADGSTANLDPAYYLVNKTPFLGDPEIGEAIYLDHNKGCAGCHGVKGDGQGDNYEASAFTSPYFNTYSRKTFDERAADPLHEGQSYYSKVKESEKADLMAKIRGFAGVPGYYFDGDVMTEQLITAASNISLLKINDKNTSYQVLITRKLDPAMANEISFDPETSKTYPFGIALMDGDGKNHIGSLLETLTFLDQ